MFRALTLIILLSLLQGCAALVVAGGAGVAAAAHDRRSLGTQLDDKTASSRIYTQLSSDEALSQRSHVSVNVFNGIALLVGQTPSDGDKQQIAALAAQVPNIRKIHNQIRVAKPTAPSTRAHDIWLQSKVKTLLLTDKRVDGLHIEVVVEDGEVFLMGLVNEDEAAVAVDIARNTSGVAQVIKAFEYRS